jgi:hypothetical protein
MDSQHPALTPSALLAAWRERAQFLSDFGDASRGLSYRPALCVNDEALRIVVVSVNRVCINAAVSKDGFDLSDPGPTSLPIPRRWLGCA